MPSLNVLLVAHEEAALASMEQALRGEEFSLAHARSLDEALKPLGDGDVQIVLLSSRLPGGSVQSAVRAMRGVHPDHPLQILLLAEAEAQGQMKKSVESGADD